MVHEVQLRNGVEAIFQRPITDAEFTAFDAIYDTTSGTVDERLNATFNTVVDSPSASSARTVLSFYQVFYGRQPDAAGFNFWTDQVDSGAVNLNQLADAFATASEFNERFGERTPTEIVFAQYRNVLGREPDFAGLTFWTDQVQSGNLSLADLGRFFATSDEAEARFDPFIDAFLVNAANGTQDFNQELTLFQEELPTDTGGGTTGEPIDLGSTNGPVNGSAGADVFQAETGDIGSGSNINGGAGADVLEVFNDGQGNAISPQMTGVETVVWTEQTNDRNSNADNNVGGYNNSNFSNQTVEVDVELDAGRISGVTRWEDFDSRADLVIEDARDANDIDGTFTGDLTVAMVSTDPGNVDYAIYFDDPVNTTTTDDSIFIQVIDQNNSRAFSAAQVTNQQIGSLEDARLDDFSFILNGERVDIVLDRTDPAVGTAFFGANATYTDLLNSINAALDNATLADGTVVSTLVSASFGGVFVENIGNDNPGAGANSQVFGRQIVIDAQPGVSATLADAGIGNDFTVTQLGEPADIAASVRAQTLRNDELVRVNVDLDDVGKGSMGGDLLIGAMSTGRQVGDDGTSDSAGIQQFDIEVDRSSQLQTINSTNNTLEVVNIVNGENDGPNNTTGAVDEMVGDLVVRGRANPLSTNELAGFERDADGNLVLDGFGNPIQIFDNLNNSAPNIATDNAMPGAVPQHDDFGFNDVRVINASTMIGAVDLTVDLSDEIVEKYLTLDDNSNTGNIDDIRFVYNLGTNNDELFVNMSDSALIDAGTASREDFIFLADGGAGNDSIVTNVGRAAKEIDGQGQDYYEMVSNNAASGNGNWYANHVANNAATLDVSGGTGNDSIWTHGWGNFRINAGSGADVVYTDNEGTLELPDTLMTNLGRNIGEHEQIDYQIGAAWTFNDDNAATMGVADILGSTDDRILVANLDSSDQIRVTVSFFGAGGSANAGTAYTSTVNVPAGVIAGSFSEQQLNQAIKQAINNDPGNVLNNVLEAVDGPGQSLAVYSKIDGDFDIEDLSIAAFRIDDTNPGTPIAISLAGTEYDTGGAAVGFQNFGGDSTAESDNRIIVEADGNIDTTVLSTNDSVETTGITRGANLNGASNETMVFREGNFGVETVFNFDPANGSGAGDRFDFEAIDYSAAVANYGDGAFNTTDDSISVVDQTATVLTDIATTYGNGTVSEHIVIVVGGDDNNGTVYLVTDTGAGNAGLVEQGNIELIGTDWDDLTFDNFL